MTNSTATEASRAASLLDAQAKAEALFDEIVARDLIKPGLQETLLSNSIRDLASDMFGTKRFWHKRIVRAGINTLQPYEENPPDRVIAEDDIVFCDFGPIFDEWEADFGRTFVLGDDPNKLQLRDALPVLFDQGRNHFDATPDVTGAQLYRFVTDAAAQAGWEFGGPHSGHLVGEFPHEKIAGDLIGSYIAPGSNEPMRRLDRTGRQCHWILEIHLVDRAKGIGGFYEQLLDLR